MLSYNKDNDLFFTCSMIEYVARKTLNRTEVIVNFLGKDGAGYIHEFADVLHCENLDKITYELVEEFNILNGDYHCDKDCEEYEFELTSVWAIGAVFSRLTEDIGGEKIETLIEVYNSKVGKDINDYVNLLYTCSPQRIYETYKEEKLITINQLNI